MKDESMGRFEAVELWQAVVTAAARAGLDPTKFGPPQREVVQQIAHFLAQEPTISPLPRSRFPRVPEPVKTVARPLVGRFMPPRPNLPPAPTPQPLILCGPPGTGKTTFISVVDVVLRTQFGLPDTITPLMAKRDGCQHAIVKRLLNGRSLSLLSVHKWAELMHFYAWDVQAHRFGSDDLDYFAQTVLAPMRIIFADEIEMSGYAPILPQMAQYGLLIVGTSNQTEFKQLEQEQLPPHLITFGGEDMRLGDPSEAVVTPDNLAWGWFEQARRQPIAHYGRLPYHILATADVSYLLLNFRQALTAPFLATEWIHFLQTAEPPLILLLDAFSLEWLRTDYNAIIRFVALFDAVEQLGIGLLVRQQGEEPFLSREALSHMKVTIQSARGVPQEIRTRALVGLDRCTSRLGQASHRARQTAAPRKQN